MHRNRKKILISGGNSLIGKDLIRYLIKRYFVISTYRKNKLKLKNKNLQQIKYDFKKKFVLNDKISYLIHLAASTPTNAETNQSMFKINKIGTEKILNSNIKFDSIVLISTLAIYGTIKKKIINEKLKPNNPDYYGKSKLLMEKGIIRYSKKNKSKYLILRLPGVIGNFRCKSTFMTKVFETLFKNQSLIYANPNSYTNNIIHTDTLAKIIISFFRTNKPKNEIFNLSSKNKLKLKDIINLIKKKLKSKSNIKIKKGKMSFYISTKKTIKNNIKIIDTRKTILKTIKFYNKIK